VPIFQFYPLPRDANPQPPEQERFVSDAAAIRAALGGSWGKGCDIWQDTRYVARVHPPAVIETGDPPGSGGAPVTPWPE
jgi:hypothetical protein